eukprot:CAMPEP_0181288334 /NCGR_PEP_ID=MMETSP1101-20121128/277_1 /TAXON_ID=46948 /ORGANISM="Rhodomonas abbreviata, Strain Caron Lab Isolate" /LENGTH=148 /DNA_ID=CAMNT_0023392449 /DNA_START=54 /DNA_END=500 /DNA_ORIENTATION=+
MFWLRYIAALALVVHTTAFSTPSLPLASRSTGPALALRSSRPKQAFAVSMVEDSILPAVAAGAAGVAAAVGILVTIEKAGERNVDKIDDQLMTKLASKVDGGDAENKFSGSDQTLDALIAAMEDAQGDDAPKAKPAAKKVVVDDDDGW